MESIQSLRQEARVPVVMADHHGRITYVNKPFEDLLQWSASEIIGKPLTTIIPKNMHDAHNLGFSRFLNTGQPTLLNKPLQLNAVKKDGQQIESEHLIIAEQQAGTWVFAARIRPLEKTTHG